MAGKNAIEEQCLEGEGSVTLSMEDHRRRETMRVGFSSAPPSPALTLSQCAGKTHLRAETLMTASHAITREHSLVLIACENKSRA